MKNDRFPFEHDVAAQFRSCIEMREKRRLVKSLLVRRLKVRRLVTRTIFSGSAMFIVAVAATVLQSQAPL